MRTRTKTLIGPISSSWVLHHVYNNVDSIVDTKLQTTVTNFTTMKDISTKGFGSLYSKGVIVNNPMELSTYKLQSGGGIYTATEKSNPSNRYYSNGGSVCQAFSGLDYLIPVTTFESDHETVVHECLSRVDKTPYAFMEDALEYRKTLKMLNTYFKDAADHSLKYATKANLGIRSGQPLIVSISNAWLSAKYGIGSLLRSSENAIEAYQKRKSRIKPERRKAKSEVYGKSDFKSDEYTNSYGVKFQRSMTTWRKTHAYCLYSTTNPLDTVPEYLGLRLKDLPRGIWNVLPYTWVTDRFYDFSSAISCTLNLLDPTITYHAAGIVEETYSSQKISVVSYTNPGWTTSVASDTITVEMYSKVRTPITLGWDDVLPSLRLDKDVAHTMDLLALIIQRLNKRR